MLPLQRRAQQPGAEDVTRFLLKNIPKRYQNAVDESYIGIARFRSLFDQFVSGHEQARRHGQAHRLGCLGIDGRFELRWSPHGKVGWFAAAKNAVYVICRQSKHIDLICSVRHEPSGPNEQTNGQTAGSLCLAASATIKSRWWCYLEVLDDVRFTARKADIDWPPRMSALGQ